MATTIGIDLAKHLFQFGEQINMEFDGPQATVEAGSDAHSLPIFLPQLIGMEAAVPIWWVPFKEWGIPSN